MPVHSLWVKKKKIKVIVFYNLLYTNYKQYIIINYCLIKIFHFLFDLLIYKNYKL